MKRFACLIAVLVVGPAASALAQVPLPPPVDPAQPGAPLAPGQSSNRSSVEPSSRMSLGELTPTPEMWFYEQSRRLYDDPRAAVRANAEYRAAQRTQRLSAQQWHGYSAARPASGVYGTYWNRTYDHSRWGGDVLSDPYRWAARPTVVLLPDVHGVGLR